MTRRDDAIALRQMLDHSREAVAAARRLSRADLDSDRFMTLALVKLAEIIGEAANRLSDSARLQHPEIAWSEIIGTRNRLVHAYDAIDLDILWQILTLDLPQLIEQLEQILPSEHR